MLLMTQRMVTWLKINVEYVEKENKQLIRQCFVLETKECSLDDISVTAAISRILPEKHGNAAAVTPPNLHIYCHHFSKSITTKRPSNPRAGELVLQGKFLRPRQAR